MVFMQLTTWEMISFPFTLTIALVGPLGVVVAAPFRGTNTPKSLTRHIKLAITRKVLGSLYTRQLQVIAGTTESNYLAWSKSLNLAPRSVDLPSVHTKAFWIGSPDAENIVIYYHGGGFAMPASAAHFGTSLELVKTAEGAGKSLGVLLLQYDLAPGATYPRQIQQAVEILRHVIKDLGKSPDRIQLMGDSSGGMLIFGVLSHLMKAHPAIEPLSLSRPPKSAIPCSPVTMLNTKSKGFRNSGQDPASAETVEMWLSDYLHGSTGPDAWNQPLTNDPSWSSSLDKVLGSMLITVAAVEMFAGDTIECYRKIKTTYKNVSLFKSEVDFHAEPGIGPMLGISTSETARVMISYAVDRTY